jgi:hypothetical protein
LHRELTASGLNGAVLLDLLRTEDPLGVLSVFVEMPADGADRRAEIEIKNKLTHLEHRAGGNGSLLRAEALRSTLALVTPTLERLQVIYDSALRYSGAIAPDGSLLAAGEAPELGKEEPRLLERILERAFHTGARVTPVDGSAADNLADAGGIAALLRW